MFPQAPSHFASVSFSVQQGEKSVLRGNGTWEGKQLRTEQNSFCRAGCPYWASLQTLGLPPPLLR